MSRDTSLPLCPEPRIVAFTCCEKGSLNGFLQHAIKKESLILFFSVPALENKLSLLFLWRPSRNALSGNITEFRLEVSKLTLLLNRYLLDHILARTVLYSNTFGLNIGGRVHIQTRVAPARQQFAVVFKWVFPMTTAGLERVWGAMQLALPHVKKKSTP